MENDECNCGMRDDFGTHYSTCEVFAMATNNISEVLERNGLTVRDFSVTRVSVPSLAPPLEGWTSLPGPRRVLETVARLLDDADAIERSLDGVTPGSAEKTDAIESVQAVVLQKRKDARAILAEVLR